MGFKSWSPFQPTQQLGRAKDWFNQASITPFFQNRLGCSRHLQYRCHRIWSDPCNPLEFRHICHLAWTLPMTRSELRHDDSPGFRDDDIGIRCRFPNARYLVVFVHIKRPLETQRHVILMKVGMGTSRKFSPWVYPAYFGKLLFTARCLSQPASAYLCSLSTGYTLSSKRFTLG